MSIRTENEYVDVVIVDAFFGPTKFPEENGKFNERGEVVAIMGDICCLVEAEDGQRDIWRGEISNRMGIGTVADKYRSDLTLKSLQELGLNVQSLTDLYAQFAPGKDGEIIIPNLIGKTGSARIKKSEKNGKVFYNISALYGKKKEEKYSFAQFQQMMAQQQPAPQYGTAPAAAPGGYYQQPVQQQAPMMQQGYANTCPQAPAAPAAPVTPNNPYLQK